MASAINLSNLSAFVDERTDELLTKAVLGPKTLDVIDIMADVKYKAPLNYLSTTVAFGDASVCGWDPSGNDTFSQRFVEVFPVKINKEWCARDMRKYWMNYDLLFAAGREKLPFEQKFIDSNLEAINVELEKEIWQNDNTKLFPGVIYQVVAGDASVGHIDVSLNSGYDGEDIINGAYNAIPTVVLEKNPVIFCSHTTFRNYIGELNAACCANRDVIDAASDEIKYPGDSRVRIMPIPGLEDATDTNSKAALAVATWDKNIVFGTDVENSENEFKYWQDDKTDMFCFKVLFNAGVAVKFPDEVVYVHAK